MGAHYGSMSVAFANLCQQLENYKHWGPPDIKKSLMSKEDILFARTNILKELYNEFPDEVRLVEESDVEEIDAPTCVDCGEVFNGLSTQTEDEVASKRMQKAQNDGIDVQYRCPRCRACTDCRRSHETERISIREEMEDQMIYDYQIRS